MANYGMERSGSVSDPVAARGQPTTPRENRIIENHLSAARQVSEGLQGACELANELRGRLLGISEPCAPPSNQKEPVLVRAELPELGVVLERMQGQVEALLSKLADLQRI